MNRLEKIGIPKMISPQEMGETMFRLLEDLGGTVRTYGCQTEIIQGRRGRQSIATYRSYVFAGEPSHTITIRYSNDDDNHIFISLERDGDRLTRRIFRPDFTQQGIWEVLTAMRNYLDFSGKQHELNFMEQLIEQYCRRSEEE